MKTVITLITIAIVVLYVWAKAVENNLGYLARPIYLDENITYRVEERLTTIDGKNTFIIRNATGKGAPRWVENSEPLASNVCFVKMVKTENCKRKLVPVKTEIITPSEIAREINEPK